MIWSLHACRAIQRLLLMGCVYVAQAGFVHADDNPRPTAVGVGSIPDAGQSSRDHGDAYTVILDGTLSDHFHGMDSFYSFVPKPGRYELRVKKGWTGIIPLEVHTTSPRSVWDLIGYQNIGDATTATAPQTHSQIFLGRDPVIEAAQPERMLLSLCAVRTGVATFRLGRISSNHETEVANSELRIVVEADTSGVERAILQAVPNSRVRTVELREGALLLRGTLPTNNDITLVMEVARLFYPQVINQLTLEKPSGPRELVVAQQQSQLITTEQNITRVSIAAPTIVDVVQYTPRELSVIGQAVGTTTLTIWLDGPDERLTYTVSTVPKRESPNGAAQQQSHSTANPDSSEEKDAAPAIKNPAGRQRHRNIDELRELRNDVRMLRQEIQHLGELLRKRQAARKDHESTESSDRRSSVPPAVDRAIVADDGSVSRSPVPESNESSRASKFEVPIQQGTPLPVIVKTYAVADLVTPLPDEKGQTRNVTTRDWLNFVDSITSTLEPHKWEANGGISSIKVFETTSSLVIRTDEAIHAKIVEWLGDWRRKMDVQLSVRCWMPRHFDEKRVAELGIQARFDQSTKTALLSVEDAKKYLEVFQQEGLQVPKITMFNGQVTDIACSLMGGSNPDSNFDLHFRGTVIDPQGDPQGLRRVRVNVAVNARHPVNDLLSRPRIIPDGGYALLDVTEEIQREGREPLSGRIVLLMEVRVIEAAEETESR